MFFDSHAHLDSPDFDADRAAVLQRARDAGLEHIIQVGYNRETIERGMSLFANEEWISFTVGIHPHDSNDFDDELLAYVEQAAERARVVAIGECGLDFFRDYAPREKQIETFRQMIRLARRLRLPLIVHSRAAEEDTLRILEEENAGDVGGVMHCYAYGVQAAARLKKMGFYIGFTCFVSYPKRNQHDTIAALKVEDMLIETDCPWIPPQHSRGKRNETAFVVEVARSIAEVKGLSIEDVARITTRNARKLFGLDLQESTVIAYPIRKSLYVNLTNRCTADCWYCSRLTDPVVKGHNLKMHLKQEPSAQEVIASLQSIASGDLSISSFEEVVFCGYGEPTMRLAVLLEVAEWIHEQGLKVRVNTNGHSDLWNKRSTAAEFAGKVDELSISLNAENAALYAEIVRPAWGETTFAALLEFAKQAGSYVPLVTFTIVDDGKVNIDACKQLADEQGVPLRVRELNETG